MNPRLEEAKEDKREVYFVDAAHFVWGAFIGSLWCIARIFMPTPSGRSRYNVLGAIHSISHELITVCNTAYITAESVCQLLHEIKRKHILSDIPITLVMDNARYQRCELVTKLAKDLKIELLFLPSYSPNLNIIERFWKWTKHKCLYCKYYDSFPKFCEAINQTIQSTTQTKEKRELDNLLTLKFQMF